MEKLVFTWDESKNVVNKKKHGVSSEEAQTVFFDEYAIEFDDPDHSEDENRFLLVGLSQKLRVIIVSHCFLENKSEIRIISARKATRKEENAYFKVSK